MKCLTCRSLAPSNARICPGCGLAFGVRLCARGHANPMRPSGDFCIECGAQEFTEGTDYMPIGGLTTGIAWLFVIGMFWLLLTHLGTVFSVVLTIAGLIFASTDQELIMGAGKILTVFIVIAIFLIAIPGQTGRDARRRAGRTAHITTRGTSSIVRGVYRMMRFIVHGHRDED